MKKTVINSPNKAHFSGCLCLIVILLFFGKIITHAENYSIKFTMSIHMDNSTMKEIFSYIEKNSEYIFVYNKSNVDLNKKISVGVDDQTVESILNKILTDTDLEYFIRGRQVIIRKKEVVTEKAELSFLPQQDNKITVRGSVKDSKNETLIGVNIIVEGTMNGTITDHEGNFVLNNVDPNSTLKFSYVGYKTEAIPLQKKTELDVRLLEDQGLIDEVVIVGYGSQRKSSLTAAVTTVKSSELTNIPTSSLISTLQGRVSGLTITQGTGEPGTGPGIQIRGVGTIDGDTGPLYVIDGVPGGGNFNNISPNDIESISVLKDASAASIYGARAANGVILVTTKKGAINTDKPTVEFSSNIGFQTAGTMPEKVSAYEYATLLNEASVSDGNSPVFDENDLNMYRNGQIDDLHGGNTNWKKMLIKDVAPIYTNHIGVSGNGKIGRYYFSGEYIHQDGLVKDIDKYNRLNLRSNITSDINDKIQLQLMTSYTRTHKTAENASNVFAQINRIAPIANAYYEDGHYGSMIFAKGNYLSDILNPVQWVGQYGPRDDNKNDLLTSANIRYTPIKDLVLNAMGSYNLKSSDVSHYTRTGISWNPITNSVSQSSPNSMSESWSKEVKYDLQLTANYEKTINNHFFKILGGFSMESWRTDDIGAWRKDFINDSLYEINAGDAATSTNSGGAKRWSVASFFGRLNYTFYDKYLLEANFRYDGSSRFAPGNQWGFFPSGSIGWNINKEGFMEDVDIVDQIKLRASIGQLGNSEKVDIYLWYAGIENGGFYNFNNTLAIGTRPGRFANTDLSWETTTTYNVGVDGSLWNGKLNLEVDFWRKNTHDILLTVPISTVIGAPKPHKDAQDNQLTVNAGKISSHGFDITVGSRGNISRDLTYDVKFSLTGWNSWVVDLKDRATQFGNLRPGEDLGNLYGYECLGIINDEETLALYKTIDGVDVNYTKLGDLQYKDQNGDGKLDYMDKVKIGNENTKNSYGININLGYKDFDLMILFQGAFNVDKYFSDDCRSAFGGFRSIYDHHLDRWTEDNPNPNAKYPRIRKDRSFNTSDSDYWVRSGAYLKLQNLQIGYNIPQTVLSKIKIENLRVYASGTNLFTIAPDIPKGFDPQTNIQPFVYPMLRVFSVGINVKF